MPGGAIGYGGSFGPSWARRIRITWSGDEPSKPRGKTVSTPPTSRSSTMDRRPSTVTSCGALLPVGGEQRVLGGALGVLRLGRLRAEGADAGDEEGEGHDAAAHGEDAEQQAPALDLEAAAPGDGGVEGLALGLGGVEVVALLDEGTLGHEVLAPGDGRRRPGRACRRASVAASHSLLALIQYTQMKATNPSMPTTMARMARFCIRSGFLVAGCRCGSSRAAGGSGLDVVVAHARSPIQKQTSIRRPTPMRSPTKPSPTGPMPPRPTPPELFGCWRTPVT